MLFLGLFRPIVIYGNRKIRETKQIDELSKRAYELISRSDIQEALCKNMNASVRLPIDVANITTPVLYEMAEKGNLPFDTMLFALAAKKISDRGVNNYCS